MDELCFIGSVRIGGIDASSRYYREEFRRFIEDEVERRGFAEVVSMVWLNHTQRSMSTSGALVYVTLQWTIDHHCLIDQLDGRFWRGRRLHCEATETTNVLIIDEHIERSTMRVTDSLNAVDQRCRKDQVCYQIARFDRRLLRVVAGRPAPGTLERYRALSTGKWMLALAMLGIRGETQQLAQIAHAGLAERSTSLKFMCANVGIDFLTGKSGPPPSGENEALESLLESSFEVIELNEATKAPQRTTPNETWYAELEESEWTVHERNLVVNKRKHEPWIEEAPGRTPLTWYADLSSEESDWGRDDHLQTTETLEPSSRKA
jgi:hypothetical protein